MQRPKNSAPLGASLVVLSSVFYASYGIWTKLMGDFFGGYTASALRSALVLLILGSLAIIYKQLQPLGWRQNWRYLLGLVVTSLLIWGPLYYAILHAGVGISLALNYAAIVLGMFFFGWLWASERLSRDKIISALLGLAGLWLVFLPSLSGLGWVALCAALLSGFNSAAHYVIAKKIPYNATQSTLAMWAASIVANTGMALLVGEHFPAIGWHAQWAYLVIFALASIGSTWLFVRGVKLMMLAQPVSLAC